MKVFEVNYMCQEEWPPFGDSNDSQYVKAETKQEATSIAIKLLGIKKSKICFVKEIKTIN